jgi:hypothetical protein
VGGRFSGSDRFLVLEIFGGLARVIFYLRDERLKVKIEEYVIGIRLIVAPRYGLGSRARVARKMPAGTPALL